MEWLVEKVGGAGYYSCPERKTLVRAHYEYVEARDCKLSFTLISEVVGRRTSSTSFKYTISLRGESPDASAMPWGLIYPCGGVLPLINQDSKGGCGKDLSDRELFRVGRPGGPMIHFRSKELADRVAKAMNHAIVLCGKEPF